MVIVYASLVTDLCNFPFINIIKWIKSCMDIDISVEKWDISGLFQEMDDFRMGHNNKEQF